MTEPSEGLLREARKHGRPKMLGIIIGISGILTSLCVRNWLAAGWALAFTFLAQAHRLRDVADELERIYLKK